MTKKNVLILISIMCFLSISYTIFMQYAYSLNPCPLCIAERLLIGFIGIITLVYALHNPQNFLMRIYGMMITLIAGFIIKISIQHLWLINLPINDKPSSCGAPLEILFKQLPLNNFLQYILNGDAECGINNWQILGISSPMMVILLCCLIIILALYITFSQNKIK